MSSSISMRAMPARRARSNMRSARSPISIRAATAPATSTRPPAPCPTGSARCSAKLSAFYAPDQENLAGDNFYLSAEAKVGIPATPFTLFAQVGRERGSFYGRKQDWSFGAEYHARPVHREPRLFRHRPERRHIGPGPQRAQRHRRQRQLRILELQPVIPAKAGISLPLRRP